MTPLVLDPVRPGASPDVARVAWRILAATGGVVVLVLLTALACLGVVAYQVSAGRTVAYPTVVFTLLAVGLCWGLHSVLRAPLPDAPGVAVDGTTAPGLGQLVERTAASAHVAAPSRVSSPSTATCG